MVSGAFVQFSRIHQWAHLIIYRLDYRPDPFMDSPHMAGAVGEPPEPHIPYVDPTCTTYPAKM